MSSQLTASDSNESAQLRRLTKEERKLQYKPGSIKRVRLKNFLTYSDVEFSPGPRLNVVIGPNGTGKSTILCAICLGLGGQPPLLGRADDARTFIMHDRDIAEIEIELSPFQSTSSRSTVTHIIKRVIDRNKGSDGGKGAGASTYYINGKLSNKTTVQKLVKETYHIAIENLCTFLPQDRVGSFSGFDSKMLLQETEKSLSGSKHLYYDHLNLIKLEQEILSSGSNQSSLEDKLKRLEEENQRLGREKELMEEREKYLKYAELLKQKHAWVVFDQTRDNALTLKTTKKQLKESLVAARKSLQPINDQLGETDHEINRIKSRTNYFEKAINNARKQYEAGLQKAELFQDEIDVESVALSSIDSMQRKAEELVAQRQAKLKQMEDNLSDYPPEEELAQTLKEATNELKDLKKRLQQARRDVESKQSEFKDKKNFQDQLIKKFTKMQDDKARRNERIFSQNQKLHQTYEWVNQNRKMFRRPVSGPIVCEISPKNANLAAYIEQHVASSVLTSYVVECKDDYNLLYREVREKRKLPINIQLVERGILKPINRMYSEERMKVLKEEHGVIGYLDEGFDTPDPILQALRNMAQVDAVLVGSSKTQESLDRKNLLDYLSEKEDRSGGLRRSCIFSSHMNKSYKYTTIISRYSGKPSLRVDDINPARMLSPGVSPEQKEAVEKQMQQVEAEIRQLEPDLKEVTSLYNSIQEDGQVVSLRAKDAKKAKNELEDAKKKVALAKRKLREAEEEASKDNDAEKNKHVTDLKSHVANSILALEHASNKYDEWMKTTRSLAGIKMTEEGLLDKARKLRDLLQEKEVESSKLEREFRKVSEEFDIKKAKLNELKEKASRIAPIKDSEGNELPLKAQLDELPGDINELEEALDDAKEKVNSIHDNPEVLRLYEEQKREIEETKHQLEGLNDAKDAKRQELKSLKEPWKASLDRTVQKINALFEVYMGELGCAGEIRISTGNTSNGNSRSRNSGGDEQESLGNFKDWGIQIRVKFREKSDLQVLSAQVHSGGERSVSTIMYLMALQDLMVSPFRCVDEINQGLDDRNERLVFRRIVANSTRPPSDSNDLTSHSGQYFLITPKLLPNLTDMENEDVTILCIFNGPYNFRKSSDWNIENFLFSRRRFSVEDEHELNVPKRKNRRIK